MPDVNFEEMRKGIEFLYNLPATARNKVATAFEDAKPTVSLDQLAKFVAGQTGQPPDDISRVAYAVSSILLWSEGDLGQRESLARGFSEFILHTKPVSPDFFEVMKRLVACENSIGVAGKAQAIMWGQGRTYQRSRIITQVRPIFFDPQKPPQHAVIIHELAVEYRGPDSGHVITVMLDARQLKELRGVVDRALAKEKALSEQQRPMLYLATEE